MHFSCVIFAAIVACAYAQVVGHPDYIYYRTRHPRDLSWGGQNGFYGGLRTDGLSGNAGYRHDLFDNNRGVLQGYGYGERSLSSDSSSYGGGLTWRNPADTMRAKLNVNQDIGGPAGERADSRGSQSYGGGLTWRNPADTMRGGLTWRNPADTMRAKLNVNQDIGGPAGATLTGERSWKLGKDSYFVAGAGVGKTEGRETEGILTAGIKKEW